MWDIRELDVSILILLDYLLLSPFVSIFLSAFKLVSILILLDYLFLLDEMLAHVEGFECLNPYFIGLSILIFWKW